MDFISQQEFRRRWQNLSTSDARTFVIELWEARGWAVEAYERGLRARDRTTSEQRSLRVVPSVEEIESGENLDSIVVIKPGEHHDSRAQILGPDELWHICRYGIEQSESRKLIETHLGPIKPTPERWIPRVPEVSRKVLLVGSILMILVSVFGLQIGSPILLESIEPERSDAGKQNVPETEVTDVPSPEYPPGVAALGINNSSTPKTLTAQRTISFVQYDGQDVEIVAGTIVTVGENEFNLTITPIYDPSVLDDVPYKLINGTAYFPAVSAVRAAAPTSQYYLQPGAEVILNTSKRTSSVIVNLRITSMEGGVSTFNWTCEQGVLLDQLRISINQQTLSLSPKCGLNGNETAG